MKGSGYINWRYIALALASFSAPPPIFNCLIAGEETRTQCVWELCYRGVKLGVVVVLATSCTPLLSDGSALAFRSRNLSETWRAASYEWMFIIWLLSEPHDGQLPEVQVEPLSSLL